VNELSEFSKPRTVQVKDTKLKRETSCRCLKQFRHNKQHTLSTVLIVKKWWDKNNSGTNGFSLKPKCNKRLLDFNETMKSIQIDKPMFYY